jgi:hypothetical protein
MGDGAVKKKHSMGKSAFRRGTVVRMVHKRKERHIT